MSPITPSKSGERKYGGRVEQMTPVGGARPLIQLFIRRAVVLIRLVKVVRAHVEHAVDPVVPSGESPWHLDNV